MKKILVVDDVYDIRVMLHEFLTLKNFDVKTADDGLEALKIMGEFSDCRYQNAQRGWPEFFKTNFKEKPFFSNHYYYGLRSAI